MVEGAGTHEGYLEPGEESVLDRIRYTEPVWVPIQTYDAWGRPMSGPPHAYRIEEREA